MRQQTIEIPISSIIFDEDIYPRKGIDHKRVGIFAENIRDRFKFDPIEVEHAPGKPEGYRLLDGAHRWSAVGRSRQTVDIYLADLRAVNQMGMDIKIFCMNRLGIPQDRISKRLGLARTSLHYHLSKMPTLASSTNSDLSKGSTVPQVAQKHGWPESMVWSQALWQPCRKKRFLVLSAGM